MKVDGAATWPTDAAPADNANALSRGSGEGRRRERGGGRDSMSRQVLRALATEEAKWLLVRTVLTMQQTTL